MKTTKTWLVFAVIAFTFLGLGALIGSFARLPNESQAASGLNDSFGVASLLFNGLALCLLILTLFQQKDEFRLQHFETLLIAMTRLHVELTHAIDLKTHDDNTGRDVITQGRDCFKVFYDRLRGALHFQSMKHPEKAPDQQFHDAFAFFWSRWHKELGHYFRSLHTILRFIDDSVALDKRHYADIVRAQLSTYELLFLYYAGLSPMGNAGFRRLATEYRLFEDLPVHLLHQPEHSHLYPAQALGG